MTTQILTHTAVETMLGNLMYDESFNIRTREDIPPDAVVVEGIMNMFVFDPVKVEANREKIKELLDELSPDFHLEGGGGMSFLNACIDKHGNHWGEHPSMGLLFALGQAAGYVTLAFPRELWTILPGGMPYYQVDTREGAAGARA